MQEDIFSLAQTKIFKYISEPTSPESDKQIYLQPSFLIIHNIASHCGFSKNSK